MADILDVWLSGRHLGELKRLRNGAMRLRFNDEAINHYGAGSKALSLSLPMTPKRVEGASLGTFIEGLLPEFGVRSALEHEHDVNPFDSFGLLRAVGTECAGAVQFTPQGKPPGPGFLRELSDDEVTVMVRDLPTLTPPDGLPVSASLSGVQAKILLSRSQHGWAWPAAGAMSTHIIKPEPITDVVVAHLVESEDWAMRLARKAGLNVANAELLDFDGRKAIVVQRYDRVGGRRIHQEDFTQALGFPSSNKYESAITTPTRLFRIANEAGDEAFDRNAFQEDLLRAITFNIIIGNGNAHSKNYSLPIDEQGLFQIAPLYDTAPVFLLNANLYHSGHVIDGQVNLKYIERGHIERAAQSWGMKQETAHHVVTGVIESIVEQVADIAADADIASLPDLVTARVKGFAAKGSRN
jgi:serine/threonine-protein kinase HipA